MRHEDAGTFPFRTELSLGPLIDFWTRAADGDRSPARAAIARLIGEQVRQAPGLAGPITDLAVLDRHRDLVDLLMSAEVPAALWEQAHGAAMMPFHLRAVYATPAMRRDLLHDDGRLKGRFNAEDRFVETVRRAHAYALVLQRLYGIALELDYPAILAVTDAETGLDRHFRLLFDGQFVDVEVVGALPLLPLDFRERLRASLLDGQYLEDVLPPERFLLRGLSFLKAIEVTDQEVLSALKRDLIDRESIVSEARFGQLQGRLRTLFRRPQLRLSLAALDRERVLILNSGAKGEHACIFADSVHHRMDEFAGTVYQEAVTSGRPLIVDDLAALRGRTVIEDQMIASGIRGFLCAPLHYQDRIIGTLDLDSPRPGDFDAGLLPKLGEVLPLFAMAVQRSMEEL